MKAQEGEQIVCKCAQPEGNFRHDVEDHASIWGENIVITLPGVPDDRGRWVCPTCNSTVAQHFGDRWGVNTKKGWLDRWRGGSDRMIRIAISVEAFEAIAPLPLGSIGYENKTNERGERLIWLDHAVVSRLRAMRGPGESYSDVILRLAAAEG